MDSQNSHTLRFTLDRRQHPRFFVQLPIEYLRADHSKFRPGHTVNLSESGFMGAVSECLKAEERLDMKIYFSPGPDVIAVTALARVVWAEDRLNEDGFYHLGVTYESMLPEHMAKLKEFLRQYADPEREVNVPGRTVPPAPGNPFQGGAAERTVAPTRPRRSKFSRFWDWGKSLPGRIGL